MIFNENHWFSLKINDFKLKLGGGKEVRSSQRFVAELAKFLPSPVTLRRHKCTNYNNGDGHDDGHGDSGDSNREMRKRTDEKKLRTKMKRRARGRR